MSLYYPSSETTSRGKTREREDRYTARFVELTPPRRIVEAITFDAVDPAFSGEMTMEVTFEAEDGGTSVTIVFKDIPSGIRPEDNEAGTQSSLVGSLCRVGSQREMFGTASQKSDPLPTVGCSQATLPDERLIEMRDAHRAWHERGWSHLIEQRVQAREC